MPTIVRTDDQLYRTDDAATIADLAPVSLNLSAPFHTTSQQAYRIVRLNRAYLFGRHKQLDTFTARPMRLDPAHFAHAIITTPDDPAQVTQAQQALDDAVGRGLTTVSFLFAMAAGTPELLPYYTSVVPDGTLGAAYQLEDEYRSDRVLDGHIVGFLATDQPHDRHCRHDLFLTQLHTMAHQAGAMTATDQSWGVYVPSAGVLYFGFWSAYDAITTAPTLAAREASQPPVHRPIAGLDAPIDAACPFTPAQAERIKTAASAYATALTAYQDATRAMYDALAAATTSDGPDALTEVLATPFVTHTYPEGDHESWPVADVLTTIHDTVLDGQLIPVLAAPPFPNLEPVLTTLNH